MTNDERKFILAGCFAKKGTDKKSGDTFDFVKVHLTDMTNGEVFEIKVVPGYTVKFINEVVPKATELIGSEVAPVFLQQVQDDELKTFIQDILPVKRK